jgi:hypothetical protein
MKNDARLNTWPAEPNQKQIGKFMREDALDACMSAKKVIVASGMPDDEVDNWTEGVRKSIMDTNHRAYVPW